MKQGPLNGLDECHQLDLENDSGDVLEDYLEQNGIWTITLLNLLSGLTLTPLFLTHNQVCISTTRMVTKHSDGPTPGSMVVRMAMTTPMVRIASFEPKIRPTQMRSQPLCETT
jgi:hypothetical protein